MLSLPSQAGVTDIATAPLFTSTTTVVKPNVLFTLDDSGSMAWDFMPDDADFSTSGFNSKYGRRASQCNGLAYNPNTAKQPYRLPVDATGAAVADASTDFLSGTYTSSVNYLPSGDVSVTASQRSVSSPASLTVVSTGSISVTTSTGSGTSFFCRHGRHRVRYHHVGWQHGL
jgi:type IV pilus assembly protein PilY1